MLPKSAVLVPLYIYPLTPTTWAPLYDAISAYPDLHFLVVVNPNSGPGELPSPDHNYAREVPKLNALPNVSTVGYVRIDYCKKPLNEVYQEIDRYASWADEYEKTALGVGGILLDETPNSHTDESVEYLKALKVYVKGHSGLLKDRMMAHNPGTPPDAVLAETADLILTSEESYDRYKSDEVQNYYGHFDYDRTQCGYMINSVPPNELPALVREVRQRAAYVFLTEVSGDFYERFAPTWDIFIQAMRED